MAKQKGNVTVGEWAIDWFHSHVEGQLAHNTEDGYRNLIFNHIVPKLGGVSLPKLSEKRMKMFYADLSNEGLSDRSVWCVHLLLRRVLDEACREGLISVNPVSKIQVSSAGGHEPVRLRPGQVRRYLEAAKALDAYPIIYVGLTSGLRQGELISLPWAAFDVSERRLLLKKRWVSLNERAVEVLARECECHPDSSFVFLDPKTGVPYTPHRLYYLHRQILKRAKLPVISFRDLQTNAKEMEL